MTSIMLQVFMDLAAGKENPQKAFMSGKIKVWLGK